MKLVHTPDMVAHLWAHQSQPEARNGTPRDSNFYFEGRTIYSYGSHFPIATHVTDKHGKPVVLFTQAGCSVTTGRHVSMARGAARHLDVLEVPNLRGSAYTYTYTTAQGARQRGAVEIVTDFDNALDALAVKAGKGRVGGPWTRELERQLAHRNAFAARMVKGAKSKARAMPSDLKALAAQAAKRAERAAAERKAHVRKGLAGQLDRWRAKHGKPAACLADWRAGGEEFGQWHLRALVDWCDSAKRSGLKLPADMPTELSAGGALLRVKPNAPDTLQTSQGAEVPLAHAERVFKLWARVQAKVPPEGWQRAGDSTEGIVGAFKIDAIDAAGTIKAGCHTIHAGEVRAFGQRMGWEA